jgi:hypothetical protein
MVRMPGMRLSGLSPMKTAHGLLHDAACRADADDSA